MVPILFYFIFQKKHYFCQIVHISKRIKIIWNALIHGKFENKSIKMLLLNGRKANHFCDSIHSPISLKMTFWTLIYVTKKWISIGFQVKFNFTKSESFRVLGIFFKLNEKMISFNFIRKDIGKYSIESVIINHGHRHEYF